MPQAVHASSMPSRRFFLISGFVVSPSSWQHALPNLASRHRTLGRIRSDRRSSIVIPGIFGSYPRTPEHKWSLQDWGRVQSRQMLPHSRCRCIMLPEQVMLPSPICFKPSTCLLVSGKDLAGRRARSLHLQQPPFDRIISCVAWALEKMTMPLT